MPAAEHGDRFRRWQSSVASEGSAGSHLVVGSSPIDCRGGTEAKRSPFRCRFGEIGNADCQRCGGKLEGESSAGEGRAYRSCLPSFGGIPRNPRSCAAIEGQEGQMMSTPETPSQPDFRERAKANDVAVARLIGFEAKDVADGHATVTLSAGPRHANPMGTLHGGILCDIADAAMGLAFASTLAPEETLTTVELKINFFRPVWQARLKAEGTVVRRGSTI